MTAHTYAVDATMPGISGATLTHEYPGACEPEVFLIEVVATDGRAAAVKLWIKADTVEVWHREHRSGVFGRDELRAWLAEPQRQRHALVDQAAAFSLDRM